MSSRFVRTGTTGRTVHNRDCRHATRSHALPWVWADGKPDPQVLAAVQSMNFTLCRHCKPLENVSPPDLREQIAGAITDGLLNGLPHPDKADTGVSLAMFRTAGLPDEYKRASVALAEVTGRAIVSLIERRFDARIISNRELGELRRADAAVGPQIVRAECEHGELFTVAVTSDTIRLDCTHLRRNLIACTESEVTR